MTHIIDKLRPYQREAYDFMVKQKACLEYDDMG